MNQEQIGKFIAETRKDKGLTQAQLAEKLGINNKTVSRWETGKNMPDWAILEDLTAALGITVNELIRGERIIPDDIVREYDSNLVSVLKEYKRMKKAKNIILSLLIASAGIVVWLIAWLIAILGLPGILADLAPIEIHDDPAAYADYIGPEALPPYRNKLDMDESLFPAGITDAMQVTDFKMVYYDPWDAQYLSYLIVRYDDLSWEKEVARLTSYPSTEYKGSYGVTGFSGYDLLAIYADADHGFVYALADHDSQSIIYVELIFCNYFLDLDYRTYIPAEYLPDGFDAAPDNAYRKERLNR